MKMILMHSPLDDPTMPYHATAYLVGQLKAQGLEDVSSRDINIEFVNYCLQRENVLFFYGEAERHIAAFRERQALTGLEQEEYLRLLAAPRHSAAEIERAADSLRDRERFADYDVYQDSVRLLNDYFGLLGALSYPASIGDFRQTSGGSFSIYNLNDLLNMELARRTSYPFTQFFEHKLTGDPEFVAADCFGISIVYDYQITYAMWFAHALKTFWPEKMVVLGGTSISQFYKHLKDKTQMKRFFCLCDAIVVGEGESAICEIARCEGDIRRLAAPVNTITYDRESDTIHLPCQIHYENVATLAPPVYSHRWELYLSPNRGINYSPTRGCYWNRCTFCDYGLNDDKPTSPWRERKIDQVMADLRQAVESQGVEYVYFAVDVMAPGYLERLSDALVASGIHVKWSAELRLEKIFSPERCEKMAGAGCVCVSFGMESGNQRILELIDKGTKVQYMGVTMKNFSDAGIAVQLMAFQGFPTETSAERESTIKFVEEHKEYWSTGGLGTFLLTGSAILAKNPEKFGIELIQIQGLDSTRVWAYDAKTADGKPHGSSDLLAEEFDASFHDHGGLFPRVLGRPWAGGTDSLHSMIYYNRYGRRFFRDNPFRDDGPTTATPDWESKAIRLTGRLIDTPFSISVMLSNRKRRTDRKRQLLKEHVEPTYPGLIEWQSGIVPLTPADGPAYWIASDSKCMRLDTSTYDLLRKAGATGSPLRTLTNALRVDERIRLKEYLKRLESAGLIRFQRPPGQAAVDMNPEWRSLPTGDSFAPDVSSVAI